MTQFFRSLHFLHLHSSSSISSIEASSVTIVAVSASCAVAVVLVVAFLVLKRVRAERHKELRSVPIEFSNPSFGARVEGGVSGNFQEPLFTFDSEA